MTISPKRSRRVIGLGIVFVAMLVVLFAPQAWSLHFQPSPQNAWLLFVLSALGFLGTVTLALILMRQIVKLYAERRAQVLGAQFKTKLVIGALALSLTPVVCMFGFTYGLINRTLDKWFSQPVQTVRDDNQNTLDLLTQFVADNAQSEATLIAGSPDLLAGLRANRWGEVGQALARHRATLAGGFAAVLDPGGRMLASADVPAGYTPPARAANEPVGAPAKRVELKGRPYLLAQARLAGTGTVEVGMPMPAAILSQIARLAQDRDRYDRLTRERKSLKLLYTIYLLLLTLAVLFGATWLALHMSRAVTVPVASLAAATEELARGNFAHRIAVGPPGGKDELGLLVDSFNGMAAEIETSREQLQDANRELDSRRRYTETLLENTPTAVISLDRRYRIERVNSALQRLFGGTGAKPERMEEIFDEGSLREVRHLLRKSERWPAATGQIEVTCGDGRQLTLAATAAAIGGHRGGAGYVLVLEDLTDLLRIQKTAAWREVAQRIAHEIKNPLTPIALSAQRIRRRLGEGAAVQAENLRSQAGVIAECAASIETEVRSLERLVNEFSAFARFPHARPVPSDLNAIIEQALRAFDGRLEGIEVRTRFGTIAPLKLDPEDMKRAFINLIDNAAEAMHGSPYRQITLATQQVDGTVEAVVADTGHGVPAEAKQRLFLPYYSTKGRGTGLGLAIVQRIVEENGGTLRAEDNAPIGARFIIELPADMQAHGFGDRG
ncbi:MAG TPA: ATP-binding protein [Terriglobales bacterium]|nr:ATP-binding protein [Terriglobales bacterium]